MSQAQSEVAIRRAGAAVALTAASALMAMGFPVLEARAHVVLALHAILLLGCAAVLLSPVHGAVADLTRRATEAVRGTTALGSSALRWLGFVGIVLYALYLAGAEAEAEAEMEAAWPDTVKGFLLFLTFLVGVWAIYLSMIRERGVPPRPPVAEPEASMDRAGVWAVYLPMVAMDTGKGGPTPWPSAEEDHDGGHVNTMTHRPLCVVVVDTKL